MDYREIRKDLGEKEHPTAIKIRKAAEDAIQKLELIDGYADVRAAIAERVSDHYDKHGKSLPRPMVPSDERLEYEVGVCEIHAEEFLKLVSDLGTVKCYLAILFANAANAWDRYVGIAPIPPNEDHPAVQRIDAHRIPWEIKAWKRIGKSGRPKVEIDHREGESPSAERLKQHRADLWAAYKAVCRKSEYYTYTHAASGIHKPEFREWKNAKLKPTSATAINFERFLKEKKLPVPVRQKTAGSTTGGKTLPGEK